jgi:hypothetical protein
VKANGIVNVCFFCFCFESLTQAKHQAQMHLFHQDYTKGALVPSLSTLLPYKPPPLDLGFL